MAVDDARFQARRELEAAGLSVEVAAYVAEARPPGGWDSLVTKDYLRAELADLRGGLRGELAELRQEVHGDIGELRTEMAKLRVDLRSEFKDAMTKQTRWLVGALLVAQGVVVAAIAQIVGS